MHTRIISAQRRPVSDVCCLFHCILFLSGYLIPQSGVTVPEAPTFPCLWNDPCRLISEPLALPAPLTPFLLRCRWLPWLQFLLVALALNRLLLPLPQHERQAPPLLYTNLDSTEIGVMAKVWERALPAFVEGEKLQSISQVGTYTEKEMARAGSIVENVDSG